MLLYCCNKAHRYTIEQFLETWGASLQSKVRILVYGDAATVQFDDVTTVIFADYDRLSAALRVRVGALADQLIRRGIRVLNHPRESLLRGQLLRELHAAKLNSFRAFLPSELPSNYAEGIRFPVFARLSNDHMGPGTDLLPTAKDLQAMLDDARRRNLSLDEMLIVEFCNTADQNGMYRKYSCFGVAGTILPRHMIASQRWVLRVPDLVTPELVEEERTFLETNPHEQQVRRVFEIAKVGYGRIDYSMVGDQMQVWEINSNPYVMYPPDKYKPLQLPNQQWFAPRMIQLFETLLAPR